MRHILRSALSQEPAESANLGEAIQRRFQAVGGVKLKLPKRTPNDKRDAGGDP